MSEEKALVPIEEKQVEFYGDELTAAMVDVGGRTRVFVPLRPLCRLLGLNWDGQRRRVLRDPVLRHETRSVVVTTTDRGDREMIALPLDFLNGFLFGISADRVKSELRDRVILYQRECYRILADAFLPVPATTAEPSATTTALLQIRELGRAIMEMAEQQLVFEQRIASTENRLDRAAFVVGDLGRRVTTLEKRLSPGNPITDEQAAEVQAAVHALAMLLTEQDKSKNHFQGIFNELHRRFGVTSYKLIPQGKYEAVLEFLNQWRERTA